ncbi:hypothetical protein FDJ20_gp124 [Vibrio phage Thalassa]|uniref:Uncharacterized protein n=2 Tax=Thalassavirus TaxID=2948922 RepID=A0A2H5BHD5_9CAUD|nr:hypothetical protein FDJ20_gp124 [Vibrio phage Thalassa]YP_010108018.1 hypothetical protein KNV05_gp123 [Vibrio phage River4]AUG85378.1 hypothetical protein THALASSA_199 [Vibrio phage Thalassa]QKN84832.1 hypothetical protein RIVER4_193 [Vibrio phage River4]
MLKGIPADVFVVAIAGFSVLLALGAPVLMAVFNILICINAAKRAPIIGKDGIF